MKSAVIIDAIRTPAGRGKIGGSLSAIHPVDLLAVTLSELLNRNGLSGNLIDDVMGGCVMQYGEQSQNITRNALLAAGLPESVPVTTIDRQCGSSQQAAAFAAQSIASGTNSIVIACGVESMSRVPIGSSAGSSDPYGPMFRSRYLEGLVHQGISAELIAAEWGLSRSELDGYSALSHSRAADAWEAGYFHSECIEIESPNGLISRDETVRSGTTVEALGALNPSFVTEEISARFPQIDWSVTAGNSSPLTDGASAVLIMSEDRANELGLKPRARFHTLTAVGSDPLYMLTGVLPATQRVLARSGLDIGDIDVFEVNEAFAPVPLFWLKETGVEQAKLNPWGGAIALGHALGSSGTRILGTMLNYLEVTGGRYGLQTMCEAGGMANATIIERITS